MMRSQRVPLAWRNLSESGWRLLASVAGTAFAVVLMLLQNGFRDALLDNMSALIVHLDGDLFVTNRMRYMLSHPAPIPRRRLSQALEVTGVASACPVYIDAEQARWRNPTTGVERLIRVVACAPTDDVLDLPAIRAQRRHWDRPDCALADERSKPALYGPLKIGTVSELQGRRIEVVGLFKLGTDFRSNGTLLMSEQNMLAYYPERRGGSWGDTAVDVGVLRTRPGADIMAVRATLEARLPPDVVVLTKRGFIAKEQRFWEEVAPLGVVFNIGLVMGFLVGLAICYQVLFSEISDRIAEFATLKAMGYRDRDLIRIVVEESVYLALLGFGAGVLASAQLFRWIQAATGLNMALKPLGTVAILGLTLVMCVLAGGLAARRLLTVDPAELYS